MYYFLMGEFTTDDRNRLIETHTLVKGYAKLLDDHEQRIRKTEGVATQATVYATLGGGLFAAVISPLFKKFFGG